MRLSNLSLFCFTFLSVLATPAPYGGSNHGEFVPLRIEGAKDTIFEGRIFTRGHNVTTESGGNHHCDGTNLGAHPTPGPTATSALDDAAKKNGFTFDGTFFTEFDDFFITRIADSEQTDTQFWGLLIDFVFSDVGGCQLRATKNTHILWAFDAFNANAFLALEGPRVAKVGEIVTLIVRNGTQGDPISGAEVGGGLLTDGKGQVDVKLEEKGLRTFKAEKEGTIRSNALTILVS